FHCSILLFTALFCISSQAAFSKPFQLTEVTIDGIHDGIRAGDVTCQQIVQAYVKRAQAYNGICTALVTSDGKAVAEVPGTVRGGKQITFPTATVAISKVVPDFDKYKGLTPDFGRMEPTASDPSVQQQFGMLVGIPNAGQVNALETINLRGERSVSCKAECDA